MGFGTMYIGATGVKSHTAGMRNVGNNLANVSTLAYKRGVVHFEDLLSESVVTGSSPTTNVSQSGKGVRVSAILTDFRNGALESSTEATDLAISGRGFFRVTNNDDVHYTRAGNFRFDKDGYLIDPNKFRLQGKAITDGVAGATGDIRLTPDEEGYFSTDPVATTAATMVLNLGSLGNNTQDPDDPFFSLAKTWDGRNTTAPLAEGEYAFTSQMSVYDEEGNAHTLSVYFDQVIPDNGPAGNRYWEYAVGMNPTEDGRVTLGSDGSPTENGAGLLMFGTLTFDTSGILRDQTAYTLSETASGVSTSLGNWDLSTFSASGVPQFSSTFRTPEGDLLDESNIALDFGIQDTAWDSSVGTTAADVGASNAGNLPGFTLTTRSPLVTTAYEGTNATQYLSQDGSSSGYLKSLFVNEEGVLAARYTNSTEKELYQITLYNFTSQDGLKREGMNHFSATKESGSAIEGNPMEEGLGEVVPQALERSNVDMATEFTHMIITQRGFQSNTKVIKTADEMLQKAIMMKR